jgi:hypothetical protein
LNSIFDEDNSYYDTDTELQQNKIETALELTVEVLPSDTGINPQAEKKIQNYHYWLMDFDNVGKGQERQWGDAE